MSLLTLTKKAARINAILSMLLTVVLVFSMVLPAFAVQSTLISPDGATWAVQRSGTTNWLQGVTYGNNTFVAVGDSGTILTSPDGATWISQSSGTNNSIMGVVYGNNTFVAVGNSGEILTSPDGATWTTRSSGTTSPLTGVTYGNNTFVTVGYYNTILTSPDGVIWTAQSDTANSVIGITYGNNTFVAVDYSGMILTSPDGVTWPSQSVTTNWLAGVTYGNNIFVVVSNKGTILTSPDGVTWIARNSNNINWLEGVTYGNNSFTAVGSGCTILTSPDGVAWTTRSSGITNWLSGVNYGNNTLVAVGSKGAILQSAPFALSAPTVIGIVPTSGFTVGGTTVTITGTSLSTVSAVYFGTTAATGFSLATDTSMNAVSPAGMGTVDVTVYGPGGTSATSSSDLFTYISTGGSSGGGGGSKSAHTLSITTTTFDTAIVGQQYSETIDTNNAGTKPYTFTVTGGTLPDGLNLASDNGTISGTPAKDGNYSFTITVRDANSNTASKTYEMTVNKPAATPSSPLVVTLTDITSHWAGKNIEKLVAMGAVSGYPDGTFKPDNTITRAEFATMLVKAFKLAPKQGKVFADLANHWAKDFISTAAAYEIVNGYDDTHFGPDNKITREQMSMMIVKAAKLSPVSGELTFTDNGEISAWAYDLIVTAVKDQIIKGYPDNTFRPGSNATRAEAITVIVNALNKFHIN